MKNIFKTLGFVLIALIMLNALLITGCNGDPLVDASKPDNSPPPPPPTATFAEIEFFPSSWGEEGEYRAEQWETNNQIKLASFFTSKPKQGDILSFKISGVSDKELKYIRIELGECLGGDWTTYNYLGSSWTGNDGRELVNLSTSFTDVLINVTITEPTNTNPNAAIYAQLVNLLWEKDTSDQYVFNSGETLPAGFQKGDVMATVSNFTISLVEIDSTHNVENNYGWNIWRDNSSTATYTSSIAEDGVCTVTIGGTTEQHGDGVWNAWKISAEYAYTGNANTSYEYIFEAWTGSDTRDLHVQYYSDNNALVYLGDTILITTTRTTYKVIGQALPKTGKNNVSFQLADQLGTVNIKMLEIKEFVIGKLTITNIPAKSAPTDFRYIDGRAGFFELYFGNKIRIEISEDDEVYVNGEGIRVVENAAMTIPVWAADDVELNYVPFTGNKTVAENTLFIYLNKFNNEGGWLGDTDVYTNKVPITFTNGNANIDFATQMELLDMSDGGDGEDGGEESVDPIEP
jgi:hypothetical protein